MRGVLRSNRAAREVACEIAPKMPILERSGLPKGTLQCNGLLLAAKEFLFRLTLRNFLELDRGI